MYFRPALCIACKREMNRLPDWLNCPSRPVHPQWMNLWMCLHRLVYLIRASRRFMARFWSIAQTRIGRPVMLHSTIYWWQRSTIDIPAIIPQLFIRSFVGAYIYLIWERQKPFEFQEDDRWVNWLESDTRRMFCGRLLNTMMKPNDDHSEWKITCGRDGGWPSRIWAGAVQNWVSDTGSIPGIFTVWFIHSRHFSSKCCADMWTFRYCTIFHLLVNS